MGRNLQKIKDSTGKRGKKFVEYAQQFLPKSYERTEIYFMMNLHDLAMKYNRLMYVTIGVGILKSRLKLIKELLSKNEVYWKSV